MILGSEIEGCVERADVGADGIGGTEERIGTTESFQECVHMVQEQKPNGMGIVVYFLRF